jgi:1-acyl-sn-glycerol-3-phosphate acyltransferase
MTGRLIPLLRSFIFIIWLIFTVIPWAIAALVLSVCIRGPRLYWFCTGWLWLVIGGARLICGVKWRIQGQENLVQTVHHSLILCPKHQSTWETFAFPVLMSQPLAFVFKQELLRIPFFGWAMARLDMIHINRQKSAQAWQKVVEQGQEFMSKGLWIIMFPEGTRAARGSKGKYKTGASRLALSTGAALVPIAVTSARCWPRRSFILKPGVIDVSIGPPIAPNQAHADELMLKVETWIETEMHRLDSAAYVTPPKPHQAHSYHSST